MRKHIAAIAGILVVLGGGALAQPNAPLAYGSDGKMLFPQDYRSWVFLTSGIDMSYTAGPAQTAHVFDNVFVDPAAYAAFRKTGAWPDRTVMVKEDRAAGNDPFNKRGQFQAGATDDVEVHVKDTAKGGWAFYAFGKGQAPAAMIAKTANCYSCHEQHGALDTTFTQFYPTLAGKSPAGE